MKNRIIDLGAHISAIPKGDLQRMMGGVKKNSEIMRTIIMNEKQYGIVDYDRTLRGFWYSVVKPALDKLDRLTPEELENNWYTPKFKTASEREAWIARTGGEKGLELDALSLDRIREVFATSLKTYIDTSAYIDTFKSYFLYDAIDRATAPYLRNVTNAVFREKWRDVTVRDFDILDYAKAGYGDAPVNEVCHMETDDMDCLIRSTLASMV